MEEIFEAIQQRINKTKEHSLQLGSMLNGVKDEPIIKFIEHVRALDDNNIEFFSFLLDALKEIV